MRGSGNPTTRRLLEAMVSFRRTNEHVSPIPSLRRHEVMVLFALRATQDPDHPGMKASDISTALMVTLPTLTPAIRILEEGGYVERRTDEVDRRAVRIKLSPLGVKTLHEADHRFMSRLDALVQHLGETRSAMLAELLQEAADFYKASRSNEGKGSESVD